MSSSIDKKESLLYCNNLRSSYLLRFKNMVWIKLVQNKDVSSHFYRIERIESSNTNVKQKRTIRTSDNRSMYLSNAASSDNWRSGRKITSRVKRSADGQHLSPGICFSRNMAFLTERSLLRRLADKSHNTC